MNAYLVEFLVERPPEVLNPDELHLVARLTYLYDVLYTNLTGKRSVRVY